MPAQRLPGVCRVRGASAGRVPELGLVPAAPSAREAPISRRGSAGKALDRITSADVEALIAAKRAEALTVKSGGNYVGFLHSILDSGVRHGWVNANPVQHVEKPVPSTAMRRSGSSPWTSLRPLLRAVPDAHLGEVERVLYAAAAATTGMRQGELIALRWQDVDWTAKRIRVRRNSVRGRVRHTQVQAVLAGGPDDRPTSG
jgi:integrase